MVRWTKSCIPQHCQNIVISLSKLISTGLSTQTHLWTYLCTTVIPKYRLDNPKHHSRHPHMFKTDYNYQHTPTDTNRHHQTFSNTPRHHSGGGWQCLGVPGAVLGCLVLSGGVLCCLGVDRKMLRAVWDAFMGVSGTWVSLGCYPRAQPLQDRAWIKQLYHVSTTPNNKICFTWLYWDIKISKCLYIRLKKMVEFCNLLIFWCPSERNYKIQLYYITL